MTAFKSNSPRKRGRPKRVSTGLAGPRQGNLKKTKKEAAEWSRAAGEEAKRTNELFTDVFENGRNIHDAVSRRRQKERRIEQLNHDMTDKGVGIPFVDFPDNPLYSESESEEDDWDDEEELIGQIHSQRQCEILLQKCWELRESKTRKRMVGKRQKTELENWNKLVAVVTGRAALEENFYFCSCEKTELEIPALTLMGSPSFFNLLTLGCEYIKFKVCNKDCPLEAGKLGLISQDYYPSTPVHPKFAVHVKVLKLFYIMSQIGPSSKFVYANALQSMLQRYAKEEVPLLSSVTNPLGAHALPTVSSYLFCIYGYNSNY
jgi:hypothetical protein